jgi:glycosyltransferase involved in cell wall biosynthesis
MDKKQPISIMIHDLNPWGGQDRSMLEIAWQLNKEFPLEIHSFSIEGYNNWPDMKHHKYEAKIKRPIFFKYLAYHIQSWFNLRNKEQKSIIQSTGTASLKSDVIQVQFIHHEWQKIAKTLPEDKATQPHFLKKIYHYFLNKYKLYLERKVYTPSKKYIAISHTIKKELMDNFKVPGDNISIIHHGVDLNYFKPASSDQKFMDQRLKVRADLNIKEDDTVLLHVGALNSRKGIFKSLEVLSYLKKQGFKNIKYLAVGQGDQKVLQPLIKKYDLEDIVILAPHTKDIRTYYWASDIFFFPTYYEPFGLVILEAMACGLPVMTSNSAGGAELLIDKHSGLLFSPHNSAEEIAQVLNTLLKDKKMTEELAKNAHAVAQSYSWSNVGKKYQNFYLER